MFDYIDWISSSVATSSDETPPNDKIALMSTLNDINSINDLQVLLLMIKVRLRILKIISLRVTPKNMYNA